MKLRIGIANQPSLAPVIPAHDRSVRLASPGARPDTVTSEPTTPGPCGPVRTIGTVKLAMRIGPQTSPVSQDRSGRERMPFRPVRVGPVISPRPGPGAGIRCTVNVASVSTLNGTLSG